MSDGAHVQVVHPAGYTAERRYAIETVFETFLGLSVEVAEGRLDAWQIHCNGGVLELPDVFFRTPLEEWLSEASLPEGPGLYGDDVFGNAFFMLTRYEEVAKPDRDEHGRFPATASVAAQGDFLERPVVNELVDGLWVQLLGLAPRLERRVRKPHVLASHDVDHPRASLIQRAAATRAAGLSSLRLRDPFDTFDFLMQASEERGLRAAFYFLVADAPYSLDDRGIRSLLRRIHARGHEIGYHASYATLDDAKRIRIEFERLVRICDAEGIQQDEWGGRAHFLRWSPESWAVWDAAGLSYDASVGFSERAGFRAGSCYEYPVFDLGLRRRLALRERPLVFMDNPTIQRLGLSAEQAESLALTLRGRCERFGGDFTCLWHNSWVVTPARRRLVQSALGSGVGAKASWERSAA